MRSVPSLSSAVVRARLSLHSPTHHHLPPQSRLPPRLVSTARSANFKTRPIRCLAVANFKVRFRAMSNGRAEMIIARAAAPARTDGGFWVLAQIPTTLRHCIVHVGNHHVCLSVGRSSKKACVAVCVACVAYVQRSPWFRHPGRQAVNRRRAPDPAWLPRNVFYPSHSQTLPSFPSAANNKPAPRWVLPLQVSPTYEM